MRLPCCVVILSVPCLDARAPPYHMRVCAGVPTFSDASPQERKRTLSHHARIHAVCAARACVCVWFCVCVCGVCVFLSLDLSVRACVLSVGKCLTPCVREGKRLSTTVVPTAPHSSRWERLERYARWRGRFTLHHLPDDLLAHVCETLDTHALCHLAAAYVGYPPCPQSAADVAAVPAPFRMLWLARRVVHDLETYLDGPLSASGFYHARDGLTAMVFLDWSPFAGTPPRPVATYEWYGARARAHIDRDALYDAVLGGVRARRPRAQVSVHTLTHWRAHTYLNPSASMMTCVPLFPHFALA